MKVVYRESVLGHPGIVVLEDTDNWSAVSASVSSWYENLGFEIVVKSHFVINITQENIIQTYKNRYCSSPEKQAYEEILKTKIDVIEEQNRFLYKISNEFKMELCLHGDSISNITTMIENKNEANALESLEHAFKL